MDRTPPMSGTGSNSPPANKRWREDNMEHEHYADLGGKSGGQKEKPAHPGGASLMGLPLLARGRGAPARSASADRRGVRSRLGRVGGLRPEAERLGLQLLIVTPLQSESSSPIAVSVGSFVTNP
jgi:uncharacterized protein YPO0396